MLQRAAARLAGNGLKAQLVRAGAGGLAVRILSLAVTMLSSVVLARSLGSTSYGLYVFVLSMTTLLALPVQVGIPTLVIRETANAERACDWVALHSIRAWVLRVNLGFGAMIVLAVLAFAWARDGAITDEIRYAWWLSAALVIPVALIGTYGAVLRGLRRVVLGQLPADVIRPLLISVLVGAAWLFRPERLDAGLALFLNLVATLVVLAIIVALAIRALPADSRSEQRRAFKSKAWTLALLPLAMMSGLQVLSQNVDLIMLGLLRGPEEVAYYRIAVSAATLIIFGLSAIQVVAMPYISRFFQERDHARLQRLAGACAAASLVMALPVLLVFVAWGRPLIHLVYGSEFVPAWEPMLVLSAAQIVNGFFGIVWPLLVMTGHEQAGFRGLLISTTANVALNALLIPIWGATGAAVASGTSIVTWNVLFWVSVRRHLRIDGSLTGLFHRPPAAGTNLS
jgi:O-antigen/teichoic acid export membrane protein